MPNSHLGEFDRVFVAYFDGFYDDVRLDLVQRCGGCVNQRDGALAHGSNVVAGTLGDDLVECADRTACAVRMTPWARTADMPGISLGHHLHKTAFQGCSESSRSKRPVQSAARLEFPNAGRHSVSSSPESARLGSGRVRNDGCSGCVPPSSEVIGVPRVAPGHCATVGWPPTSAVVTQSGSPPRSGTRTKPSRPSRPG
jgi:hypothetical protein